MNRKFSLVLLLWMIGHVGAAVREAHAQSLSQDAFNGRVTAQSEDIERRMARVEATTDYLRPKVDVLEDNMSEVKILQRATAGAIIAEVVYRLFQRQKKGA